MERPTTPGEPARASGFTLIELITVIAIIGILAAIALPNYKTSIIKSKEAVLMEDLYRLRDAIDQYYVDKGHYPESIETLVTDGYLRVLPADPMTGRVSWNPIMAEPDPDRPDQQPGVYDVKSASEEPSLTGKPYSEW